MFLLYWMVFLVLVYLGYDFLKFLEDYIYNLNNTNKYRSGGKN